MKINVDLIYPVGSLYMTTNTISPETLFGGTWEKITSDAYLKIVDSAAGNLGGTSSDHKIPISSMPSHNHGLGHGVMEAGNSAHNFFYGGSSYEGALFATGNTGGGNAYYPYYYGIYLWRRIG